MSASFCCDRLIVLELVGPQQDVTRVHLRDDRLLHAAANLVQAEQVEAARRADRLGDLAGLHLANALGDDRRQLRAAAPAERAAFDVGAAFGVRDGELREILAALRLVVHLARALLARLDLLGRGRHRHGDQDVRDVVLGILVGRVLLPRHELLELARRDVDAADDVALTQQLQRHLAADLVAEIAIVDALLRERLRQIGEADVVALGDVVERAVQHFVGHLDAEAVGALHLDLLDDQPLEDLPAQHVARRQLGLLLTQALDDLVGLRIELADEHDAVVDDGGDAVEQLAAAGELARLGERGAAGERERHGQERKDEARTGVRVANASGVSWRDF